MEAKFVAPTRVSEANFGVKPPQPPNMEVPPLGLLVKCLSILILKTSMSCDLQVDEYKVSTVCYSILFEPLRCPTDETKFEIMFVLKLLSASLDRISQPMKKKKTKFTPVGEGGSGR